MTSEVVVIAVRTAATEEEYRLDSSLRLIDACRLLRIPPNAVSSFVESASSSRRFVGMYKRLSDLTSTSSDRIILQFDRNINYTALRSDPEAPQDGVDASAVAEYTFASGLPGNPAHVSYTAEQCQSFVLNQVDGFVEEHVDIFHPGATIVVGASGGGDSNAVLTALSQVASKRGFGLVPVVLTGSAVWDGGCARAQILCNDLGLPLEIMDTPRINKALGRPPGHESWRSDFLAHFPLEDPEIIGTLAIRLALAEAARAHKASAVVTGLNLEDILAECFLRLMQGKQPLEFPVRNLDGTRFCYPAYSVPKKILDGCHPKFSASNYDERSVGVLMGRAIPYFLAQNLNALVPSIEFDLLKGFQSLVHEWPQTSPTFGFATVDEARISPELTSTWQRYIRGEAPAPLTK